MSLGGGTSTNTVQELSPEQRQLFELVLPAAENISARPPTMYPGSGLVPFDPLQVQAQEQVLQAGEGQVAPLVGSTLAGTHALQGFGLPTGAAGAAQLLAPLSDANVASSFLTNPDVLSPQFNPYTEARADAAIRPVARALTTQALPAIRNEAVQADQFGSSRHGIAEGLALEEFNRTAGDISTGIYNTAFQQHMDAMVRAMTGTQEAAGTGAANLLEQGARSLFAAPSIANLTLSPGLITESVGAQRQAQSQALLSEEVQRYLTEQMVPFLVAQDIAGLAFGLPGGAVQSSSSLPGMNPMQGLFGLGAAGLGLLGGGATAAPMMSAGAFGASMPLEALLGLSFVSDRRVKRSVQRDGQTAEGYPQYRFRYVWDTPGTERRGVMADEVPAGLVSYDELGYARVDYSRVTLT